MVKNNLHRSLPHLDRHKKLPAGLASLFQTSLASSVFRKAHNIPQVLFSFGFLACYFREMATLADELLNDFEDSGSEDGNRQNDFLGDDDQEQPNLRALRHDASNMQIKMELDGDEEEVEDAEEEHAAQNGGLGLDNIPDEEETKAKVEKMNLAGVGDVRSVAVLMKTLQPVLEVSYVSSWPDPFTKEPCVYILGKADLTSRRPAQKIAHFQSIPHEERTTNIGAIEDNPEYKLLTQSNSLSTQIESEIILVHKFIRDHYSARFPELERLVTNPLDYAKTVAILKNGPL